MNSLPEDREQAERRARMTRKRTPAQQERRARRETAFNAGFAAAAGLLGDRLGVPIDFGSRRYREEQAKAYSAWEYSEDRP